MSSYSAFRLFFRLEKPGRLPIMYGNVGLTCTTPFLERQQLALRLRYEDQHRTMGLKDTSTRFKIPQFRHYSTSVSSTDVVKADEARLVPKKKGKTIMIPQIMLISETKHITIVTLEEAKKIAERKSLQLVLVPGDNKLTKDKPIYKLVTNAEFLASPDGGNASDTISRSSKDFKLGKDENKKEKEKDVKMVLLKSKTADNDVLSKVKQMVKWVEKGHSVRVMIGQAGEKGDVDRVYKFIEENMKETGARFLQKVVKGDQIRFQISPPKQAQPVTKQKNENI